MNALRDTLAGMELGGDILLEPVGYSLPGVKSERTLLIVGRKP